eukprot:CAMPEP_0197024234 /NCGR_PEP_ID=MMETSP1384-20130603/4836_1 /TAXON_ID=29189 /ORGANISM="Ammonia sp." /LENGTH=305 /DNA_ID=CAMNT_0042452587 /DNA_START=65 /DNA_END=982 /DNA_ORIENTATION=+
MQETMHKWYQSGLLLLNNTPQAEAAKTDLCDSQSDAQYTASNDHVDESPAKLTRNDYKSASRLLIDLYATEQQQSIAVKDQEKEHQDEEEEEEEEKQMDVGGDEEESDIMETVSNTCFKWYSWLNTLDQNDKHFTSYIQQLEFGCIFEIFMLIPTIMYSVIGISILVLIYSIVFRSLLYFINVVLCLVINEAIKRRIKRKRPNIHTVAERMIALDGVLLVKRSASMPSGDTAQCSVFACTMIYTMLWFFHIRDITWWWMLITIPVVAFERIYFGKHWLGDTFCGAIEGALIVIVVCATFGPYLFF